MSKKNNVTENPADRLARLQREMDEAKNELQAVETARINAIAAQIDGLPKVLGVATLDEVSALIRQRVKGTLGSLVATPRVRTEVTKEQKAAAIESIRNGSKQRSAVVAELGIHAQTLHNWLKEAGLVNSRTVATPAPEVPATAPVTSEATATVAA